MSAFRYITKLIDPVTVRLSDTSTRVIQSLHDFMFPSEPSYPVFNPITGLSNNFLRVLPISHLDYSRAISYFSNAPYVPSACTSASYHSLIIRNYDWLFDNMLNFVVRSTDPLYHKSLGVACVPDLNYDLLSIPLDLSLVPFFLLDGINDQGLYASMNVVPLSPDIPILNTKPLIEQRESISAIMLVRYILDHFSSVQDSIDYLKNYVSIFHPKSLVDLGFSLHFHLADSTQSIILEFNGTNIEVISNNISTNFYQQGVANLHSFIPTPYTHSQGSVAPTDMGIKSNSQGLERYNLCLQSNPQSLPDALDLLKSLFYSKLYTEQSPQNIWYSELTGLNSLTVDSDLSDFTPTLNTARTLYLNRDRSNPQVWISRHSCVYDIQTLNLNLMVEEFPEVFTFTLL